MTKMIVNVFAVLMFSTGTAFASLNPPASSETFEQVVERIIAETAEEGCGGSYRVS